MNKITKTLFKINNEVVVEESNDMTIEMVERMKWIIAEECECQYDEIEVEIEDVYYNPAKELSDEIDVGANGLHFWRSDYPDTIIGVKCQLVIGSDEYLDAINNGTIEKYLKFFI